MLRKTRHYMKYSAECLVFHATFRVIQYLGESITFGTVYVTDDAIAKLYMA